jgi:hypothetical protein
MVVVLVDPPRALVLRGGEALADLERPPYFVSSWAFVTEPLGDERARLIVRGRYDYRRRTGTLRAWFFGGFAQGVMERKMLLGIRERAECQPHRDC